MPGTLIFKPLEANLTHSTSHFTSMDPYCTVIVGNKHASGEVCPKGGKHPHWNDSICVETHDESTGVIEINDKSLGSLDQNIGKVELDLKEIESRGSLKRWYPLYFQDKPAGQILLEATYKSEFAGPLLSNIDKQMGMGLVGMVQPEKMEEELAKKPQQQQPNVRPHKKSVDGIYPEDVIKIAQPRNMEAMERANSGDFELKEGHLIVDELIDPMNPKLVKQTKNDISEDKSLGMSTTPTLGGESEVAHLRGRAASENLGKQQKQQGDRFHSPYKESPGLDLTSDLGPHVTGYDKGLWNLPDNVKELDFSKKALNPK